MPTEQLTRKLPEASNEELQGLSPSAKKTGAGLLTSLTFQLVCLLTTVYLLFWSFYPWRPLAELDMPTWMVKFASNTAQMVRDSQAPIITMGTSLIGAPIGRLKRPNLYQEILSSAAGQNLPTDLISSPGAVMSDQAFIVHELFCHNKKPKLIILTFAARDFMDNEVADRIAITPTRRVVTFINKRQSFLPGALSWNAINDCVSNHILFADLLRRHWLKSLSILACHSSGHPMTLWDGARNMRYKNENGDAPQPAEASADNAVDEKGGASDRAKLIKLDLELYNKRYNPYNATRTDTQLNYLRDLLAECKQHGTRVLMVGMPVSPANNALLKPGVYTALNTRVLKIASSYGASVIDINALPNVQFSQADFNDTVHLTKDGSQRFVPVFTSCVLGSTTFKQAFPRVHQ